jgi:Kef-type K+ transport system membrane component KefB
MNTRGLIEIVLLTVGRDAGLIDDRLFTLLALMAIVTTLLTAPLLAVIVPDLRRGGARRAARA